ncbi:MAG: hypothetical protein FJW37_04495 [Acidobacteria bacterium]|nr:hypothetical protein [Acidobacteriota bacterium]
MKSIAQALPISHNEAVDQRKHRRFDLKLALAITRHAGENVSRFGETRNIGSGGVLFSVDGKLEVGDPIEFVISLPGENPAPVSLRCLGIVLRQDALAERGPQRAVAATVERYEFIRQHSSVPVAAISR